jgi:lipocalin
VRTKINYQKADGKWYELTCYDYSIEQDDEKLTSDNSDYQSINIDNACLWTYDENHDYYETECEHAFCIIEGTPKDNDMKYCPYCGKEIKTK